MQLKLKRHDLFTFSLNTIALCFLMTARSAHAEVSAMGETLEGIVRVAGGGITQEVQLTPDDDNKGQILCDSDDTERIKKLAAMTVKAKGVWKFNKQGQKSCFVPASFVVTKHTSGREPIVGTLTKINDSYVVKSDDGQEHVLNEVSGGLKKLEGKKVIIDAKPMTGSSKSSLKVVAYGAYP